MKDNIKDLREIEEAELVSELSPAEKQYVSKPKIGIVNSKDIPMAFNDIKEIEESEGVKMKEYAQLIGFRLKKGQKVFEINHDTFMVGLAETLLFPNHVRVTPKPRHCYVVALNKDNAIRKYTKMMLQLLSKSHANEPK